MTRRQAKSFIALAAAYAIALQAVFAGLTLGARTGEAALLMSGGLCLTGQSQDVPAPADRMPCCSLAACCPSGTDAAAASAAQPLLATPASKPLAHDLPHAGPISALVQGPQQPRAPPAV